MVTRGPGAANAAIAVHTAWQDATPLVLLVGLVPVADRDREAFQEFSLTGWFGSTAKLVLTVEDPDRAAAQLAEAFAVAAAGRPGPVVVGLPEDVLVRTTSAAFAPARSPAAGAVSAEQRDELGVLLERARRPLVIVGGDRWTAGASAAPGTGRARRGGGGQAALSLARPESVSRTEPGPLPRAVMSPASVSRIPANWSQSPNPSTTSAPPGTAASSHRPAATARSTARSRALNRSEMVVIMVSAPFVRVARAARSAVHPDVERAERKTTPAGGSPDPGRQVPVQVGRWPVPNSRTPAAKSALP